ncbi:MAG: HsmA family protein [Patescibacteria group bacterium]|jgi:uncharacterized repeat protein (TIGR03987 family)
MFFGIALILTACLVYSIAIWTEQVRGKLSHRLTGFFGLGFIADTLGTSAMFIQAHEQAGSNGLHGVCGKLALTIMGLHLLWALTTLIRPGRSAELFNRFSPFAWCLWMVAFLTGIPVFQGHLWLVPVVVWCLFVYLNAYVQYRREDLRLVTAPVDILTRLVLDHTSDPVASAAYCIVWLIASPIISFVWIAFFGISYTLIKVLSI